MPGLVSGSVRVEARARMAYLAEYDVPALQADLRAAGLNAGQAGAVLRRFYASPDTPRFDPARFGRRLCEWLANHALAPTAAVRRRWTSRDGTIKLLLGFPDGGAVECVLMPAYRQGRAMGCVSSQIGCAMGCDFCASARPGLARNLTAGEIVQQFVHLRIEADRLSRKLTSVVFMGMGEPMHNLDAVLPAIRRIADPNLGALGWRQVTVSTVGVVPGIDRLASAGLNVNLALSLHAPDDATRSRIVPINRKYPMKEMLAAARRFHAATGRIVTIEYCLLSGVNDADHHAAALAEVLAGFRAHVNLIPHNPIGAGLSGATYARPSPDRIASFLSTLRNAGVVSHLRQTRGDDQNAACGQLAVIEARSPTSVSCA